jgi:hydrogenase expression/formation protein HypC
MSLAVPGKIVEIYQADGRRMGRVDLSEIKETCLDLVPEAKVGDYCIIHAGFAIGILDEQVAMATLDLFRQMDEVALEIEMAEFPSAGPWDEN